MSQMNTDFTYERKDIQNGFQLIFTASLQLINRVYQESKSFMQPLAIATKTKQDIELGIHETLANAIRHGAKEDNETLIHYSLTCDKKLLITIIVTDPGTGFDWSQVMQHAMPNLTETGRGLLILQNCFDTIEFNSQGNEITLLKQIRTEKERRI